MVAEVENQFMQNSDPQAHAHRYRHLFNGISSGVAVYESKDRGQSFIFVDLNHTAETISGFSRDQVIGRDVVELFPSVVELGLLETFQRVWRTGQAEYHPTAEFHEGQFAGWIENYVFKLPTGELAASFRDITTRKLAKDELKQQKELLENVIEAIDQPFSVIDVQNYKIEIANKAALALDPEGELSTCYALMHKLDAPCQGPDHICPIEEVVRSKRPVVVEHIHIDSRGRAHPVEVRGYPLFDRDGQVRRMIEHTMDISDRKKSEKAGQKAAAAAERERLAQELHDAVSQNLFSAGLITELLPDLWEIDQEQARSSLGNLRQLIRATSAEMRSLLLELRPDTLSEASLASLLDHLCQTLSDRSAVTIHKEISSDIQLPGDVKIPIYRVTQEAFTNIAKHARANTVWLQCRQQKGELQITIKDDGLGFDPQYFNAGHMGLRIMKERLEKIGGTFSLQSQIGQGTTINLKWSAAAEDPI